LLSAACLKITSPPAVRMVPRPGTIAKDAGEGGAHENRYAPPYRREKRLSAGARTGSGRNKKVVPPG